MKRKEALGIAPGEREGKIAQLRLELMKLRSAASTGTAQKGSGKIRAAKRAIARILTLQKQGGKDKE